MNTSKSRDDCIKTRKDQVLMARLRTGKHYGFRSFQHLLNNDMDPHCPRCDSMEEDTVEHWLDCDATVAARMQNFGYVKVGLGALTENTRECLALARSTLRGAEWR